MEPVYLDEKIIKKIVAQPSHQRLKIGLEFNEFMLYLLQQGLKNRHHKNWKKYFKKIIEINE